jgi:IS5 family transposase
MGRNYLVGTHDDAANAVLAAAGYNFRRLLEWLALLLSAILAALKTGATQQRPFKLGQRAFLSSSQATASASAKS